MAGIHYLQFSDASSSNAQVSYSLLELPAALLSQLDAQIASGSSSSSWVIKGQPQDDAVLCTYDETYNVRGVQNSNSLLLCQPSVDAESDTFGVSDPKGKRRRLDIQGTLHQTLELEKAIPRLDRLTHMLRNHEWSPDEADTTNNKVRGMILQQLRILSLSLMLAAKKASTPAYCRGYLRIAAGE